jgi:hypothetical protein
VVLIALHREVRTTPDQIPGCAKELEQDCCRIRFSVRVYKTNERSSEAVVRFVGKR